MALVGRWGANYLSLEKKHGPDAQVEDRRFWNEVAILMTVTRVEGLA